MQSNRPRLLRHVRVVGTAVDVQLLQEPPAKPVLRQQTLNSELDNALWMALQHGAVWHLPQTTGISGMA